MGMLSVGGMPISPLFRYLENRSLGSYMVQLCSLVRGLSTFKVANVRSN